MTILVNISVVSIKHRGMGHFTKEIVEKLVENQQYKYIFVSGNDIDYELKKIIEDTNNLYIQINTLLPIFEQIVIPYLIYKYKPDMCWFPSNTFPLIKPKNTKYIATIHDLIFFKKNFIAHNLNQYIGKWYRTLNIILGIKKIDITTSVSRTSLTKIYKLFRLGNFNKNQILYNNFKTINLKQYKNDILDKFNLTNKKYIYTISGTAKHKNLDFLIDSFLNLYDKDSSYYLVITGLPYKKYNNKANIIYTPYLQEEDKIKLISNADLFVFVSLEEGFGIPVIEGLCYNDNVLVSNIPVFKEIGQDYVNYCNPKDTNFLIKYFHKTIHKKYTKQDRVNYIQQNFNSKETVQKLEKLFDSLC